MNYKQTKLFSEFQCVGGSCVNNCCHDWSVLWSGDGVEKLKAASDCSEKLKRLVRSVFVQSDNGKYNIKLKENGDCPFQLEDGLCIIQKELGESYLSDDCTFFPRIGFAARNSVYCSCVLSCPAVFQKLLDEENAAVLLTLSEKPDIRGTVRQSADRSELAALRPELKYHKELLEFFYEIISDKRFSTEVNIVRGALAAEKLSETAATDGKIAGMIEDLREALEEDDVIRVVEEVHPEYEAKLRMFSVYTESLCGSALADLFKDGEGRADVSVFAFAEEKLAALVRPFGFGNIVLGLLLEMEVPFRFRSKSIYENYCEFAVVAAVVKMTALSAVINDKLSIETGNSKTPELYGIDRVSGLCSFVIRRVNQNIGAVRTLFELFSPGGITPRDIAMLIK
ncbi:MAG: flagellin lysine-N-methylase [Oscillospiraceae bacterium]|nr:flagellin lysine-N-methylase [Oscillospiraceae bacterium]